MLPTNIPRIFNVTLNLFFSLKKFFAWHFFLGFLSVQCTHRHYNRHNTHHPIFLHITSRQTLNRKIKIRIYYSKIKFCHFEYVYRVSRQNMTITWRLFFLKGGVFTFQTKRLAWKFFWISTTNVSLKIIIFSH